MDVGSVSGAHFDAGTGNACDERAGKWDGWQFNGRAIDIRPLYRNIYPRARLAQKFKLSEETLFLSVDYVDRYMCTIPLENSGLKLLAVVSLLVASKVAEINDLVPSIWELRELCHNVYCRREIVAFERNLLLSLKYHLNVPTARSAIELMHCHSSSDACAVDLSYASQTLFRSLSLAHTHPWTAHARGRYRRSHYLALTSAVPPPCFIHSLRRREVSTRVGNIAIRRLSIQAFRAGICCRLLDSGIAAHGSCVAGRVVGAHRILACCLMARGARHPRCVEAFDAGLARLVHRR